MSDAPDPGEILRRIAANIAGWADACQAINDAMRSALEGDDRRGTARR